MVVDPRKRQKKLERRKAKAKAERRKLGKWQTQGVPGRMRQAATAPILHCCAGAAIWQEGIGQILISRQLSSGMVAFGCFLVDTYCLGVKNAFMNIVPHARYADLYGRIIRQDETVEMQPECARKLIEGAVEYADKLGFSPHPDYQTAKLIFGNIDVEACHEEFTFGKDGKPFFVAGPYDSPAHCEQIIRTLHDRCGLGRYHFVMPADERFSEELRIEGRLL